MAGFEEIIKLQPWLNPGHKNQEGEPVQCKDNFQKVVPGNLIYLNGYLVAGRPRGFGEY